MKKIAIIGLGLIGSSICRNLKDGGKYTVYGFDINTDYRDRAKQINFCHSVFDDLNDTVKQADVIVLATPLSSYQDITKSIATHLKQGAILTDVGSVKQMVIKSLSPHIPSGVHFVPAHPISGTEKSGPDAGYASLFKDRYTIITPQDNTDKTAIQTITTLWHSMGAKVDTMTAHHHDMALAITSHIPHLLAFTLVGTASGLEHNLSGEIEKTDIMKYSAGGFRDATRVAASDPVIWRDIFINNSDAILQIIEMFGNDLKMLKSAIKSGDNATLQAWLSKTREIRLGVIEMGQADYTDPVGQEIISLMPYNQ